MAETVLTVQKKRGRCKWRTSLRFQPICFLLFQSCLHIAGGLCSAAPTGHLCSCEDRCLQILCFPLQRTKLGMDGGWGRYQVTLHWYLKTSTKAALHDTGSDANRQEKRKGSAVCFPFRIQARQGRLSFVKILVEQVSNCVEIWGVEFTPMK